MAKSKFPPLLHLTYILQQSSDELLLAEVGIGLSHARIMSGLSTSAGVSQRYLAGMLRQTESNVSRQLQLMHKEGLVSIGRNKKDHRQREVTLTRKGQSKYQAAENLLNKQQKNLLKIIDVHELAALREFTGKLK